ncbi:MAG: hypothetical protein K1000chlam2_01251 [Chlamydiae bacterium]|nr:hypothetical protein [Chlamydiota bacterium]
MNLATLSVNFTTQVISSSVAFIDAYVIQGISSGLYNCAEPFIPTTGPEISKTRMCSFLSWAEKLGNTEIKDPTTIQKIWFLRPVEYVQTSLMVSARKFYYFASASSNNERYVTDVAQAVRGLAQTKIANKPVLLESLQDKVIKIFGKEINNSSFNYTQLVTYVGTGVAKSVLSWGMRYYIASWIYPDIPYLSTAATLATLYAWTICITPNVRSELLNAQPLPLPKFTDKYTEEMHAKISTLAESYFKDDDVGSFRDARTDIVLPETSPDSNPFPAFIAPPQPPTETPKPPSTQAQPKFVTTAIALVSSNNNNAPTSIEELKAKWSKVQLELKNIQKNSPEYLRHYADMDKLRAKQYELEENWPKLLEYEKRIIDKKKQALEKEGKSTTGYLDHQLKELHKRIRSSVENAALQKLLYEVQDHINSLKPVIDTTFDVSPPATPQKPLKTSSRVEALDSE